SRWRHLARGNHFGRTISRWIFWWRNRNANKSGKRYAHANGDGNIGGAADDLARYYITAKSYDANRFASH
ncbi:MAG: hypothetical protein B6D41_08665, partial [Chloroflexi bacterium UTCFX4]